MEHTLGRGGNEAAVAFSSTVVLDQQGASPSSQDEAIFDKVIHMAIDTATETQIAPIAHEALDGDLHTEEKIEVPSVFKEHTKGLNLNPNIYYKEIGSIKKELAWFEAKKNQEGKPTGNIEGSVVGRVGEDIVVEHAGMVNEPMVLVTSYVEWDPKHPNNDLRDLGELIISGYTGKPEVRITEIKGQYEAGAFEFSGWNHQKRQMQKFPVETIVA